MRIKKCNVPLEIGYELIEAIHTISVWQPLEKDDNACGLGFSIPSRRTEWRLHPRGWWIQFGQWRSYSVLERSRSGTDKLCIGMRKCDRKAEKQLKLIRLSNGRASTTVNCTYSKYFQSGPVMMCPWTLTSRLFSLLKVPGTWSNQCKEISSPSPSSNIEFKKFLSNWASPKLFRPALNATAH